MTPEERRARALKAVAARKWHRILTPAEKAAKLKKEKAKPAAKRGRPRKDLKKSSSDPKA
jgi:hypothetical protein